ncbi:uncharacterized protein P884DRAFT_331118 [Thermothelomyces heterothallicus CBS 202.75]|uniref:uncharacterized protein n=1 Tax=Thermothelomyces heterothallicus CBS 202.75 TaxID=1149848 RepID=UPI0037425D5C
MPGPVSSADLDRSTETSDTAQARPDQQRSRNSTSAVLGPGPGPVPNPDPDPGPPDQTAAGPAPLPRRSCSTRRSNPDLAARPAARTSSDGEDRAEEGAQRALVPLPRPRRRRRLSSSDASVASGPDEYTVYPDGRISYEREDRPPYRRSRHPRPRPRPRPRRAWRRGARGEPYDDWEDPDPYWGRDRYRGDGKEDVDREKRRRRAREEGKGLLIAALVFLAGLILCSD